MMKNAYIKFMCWLYYKFERIVSQLGEKNIPKILYEGEISNYELKLLTILSNAGCDIVLLQYKGDQSYLKLDPSDRFSFPLKMTGLSEFLPAFCLKTMRQELEERMKVKRLYGTEPSVSNCTNAWIEGKGLEDVKKSVLARGNDPGFYYNCFIRINGVEDKLAYQNELYQFQLELKNSGRSMVILDGSISPPSMEEIKSIDRRNYNSQDQMLIDLSKNVKYSANVELQRLINKTFIDIMSEEAKVKGMNLNKLTNKAVYLLCWLKRYQAELFKNWKMPDISCFIYLGGCKNENEAMFLRFLSRLPADVLILNPNLNVRCCLEDQHLYEIHYTESLAVDEFPREDSNVRMATAAYHAERELDTLMYQDSGIFRNRQHEKGVSVTLQTMYEEIAILWDQELKYRPNFSVVDSVVNMPVIFSKVSGIKDKAVFSYWADIKKLITEDTLLIRGAPYIHPAAPNPVKAFAVEFIKNGRLQREKIKAHKCYQYSLLRDEVQDHILEKIQILLDEKIIKGTFENGTEYTIVATILNMNKELLRMIQKFDFTKKNPKVIYIDTTEDIISLEDSILIAFLNLAGF